MQVPENSPHARPPEAAGAVQACGISRPFQQDPAGPGSRASPVSAPIPHPFLCGCRREASASYLERPCHLILISPLWSPLALRSCHMKTMKVKAASQISRDVAVPRDTVCPRSLIELGGLKSPLSLRWLWDDTCPLGISLGHRRQRLPARRAAGPAPADTGANLLPGSAWTHGLSCGSLPAVPCWITPRHSL